MAGADEELPCNFSNLSLVGDDLQVIRPIGESPAITERSTIHRSIRVAEGPMDGQLAGQGETLHL